VADANLPPDIPEQFIKELAASGALCERCGGIHQVSIDQIILTLPGRFTGRSGMELPWCTCAEKCPTCGPFLSKVNPIAESLLRQREEKQPR